MSLYREIRMPDFDDPIAKQFYAERVLVAGDRNWKNRKVILGELLWCPHMKVLIHGDCPTGADRIADEIVRETPWFQGYEAEGEEPVEIIKFAADWDKYGKAAGPIRNKEMQVVGNPDFVLAFHASIDWSRGTKNMVGIAKRAGIPVKIVTGK